MERSSISARERLARSVSNKALIALAACALLVCAAFSLAGCKPPAGQLAANAAIAEMAAIESHDPASIDYLPEVSQAEQLEQIGISQEEFFGWWLEGFTYSLGDLEMNIEEDGADINAKITCRQLEPIIKQWSNEYVEWLVANSASIKAGASEDPCEYGRELLRGLFEGTEPVLCETMIHVQKYDDEWSVVGDAENGIYHDALLGSADNLSGYYAAPLAELANLGVTLPVSSSEAEQSEQNEQEN